MNGRGIERDREWKDGGVSWTTSNRLVPEIFYSAGTEVETEIKWSSEQPDCSSFYFSPVQRRILTTHIVQELWLSAVNVKIKVHLGCNIVAIQS